MRASEYVADFDSATAMLRALSRFLDGRDFPMLGVPSFWKGQLAAVNKLPRRIREEVYRVGGWLEALPPDRIGEVSSEQMAEWVAGHYPRRRYPAVMIGSSNGAAVHLAAALGIPWFPQTLLLPVRQKGVHPDEFHYAREAFRETGRVLLERNPNLQLHHMHDPNQDRLMLQRMGYFRVKQRTLPEAWKNFLQDWLEPGGLILLLDCGLKWPVSQVADRYYFQAGAVGGLTPEEYGSWNRRVMEFLGRHGSHRRRWEPPKAELEVAEAEWGFEPALVGEVERFAGEKGFVTGKMRFEEPADLPAWVAELYRWWYGRRGLAANRLVVESFILMEPWWVLRTGSIPFWMVFNKEPSAESLGRYLAEAGPFEEIYAMLFSHGVESVGLVGVDGWRRLIRQAKRYGGFIGVDESRYPRDFAAFLRYHSDFKNRIKERYDFPDPLSWNEVKAFDSEQGRQQVKLEGGAAASRRGGGRKRAEVGPHGIDS